jgi:mono/diheme cytochrome c family protein/uncharacterized membrane protein
MTFITEFQQTWADPQMRHALIVHWPVVLSVLSAVFTLALALTLGKNQALRIISLLICVGVIVFGYLGLNSGEIAEHASRIPAGQPHDTLEAHEELAEKVPLFGAICAGLVLIAFLPKPPLVRKVAAWLAFLACLITAGWVANTAHYGGQLVYDHGIGLPEAIPAPSNASSGATVSPLSSPSPGADPRLAFFQANVKPILIDTCGRCHNPSRARRSGGLDQTTREALMRGGNSGPVVVTGKPEESLLVTRVKLPAHHEDRMPPAPRDPLTAEQIAALEQWIRDGAVWDD